jgi:lipoprotein-anchoring transpeptidase ErfK/SrfK
MSYSDSIAEGLARPSSPYKVAPQRLLIVDVPAQTMTLYNGGAAERTYKISTAKTGIGGQSGTYKTPPGWMSIESKIGGNAAQGSIFVSKKPTGEVWRNEDRPDDLILTRVLPLVGLEPGVNKGGNVDTFARAVYIHGTNRENDLGTPVSHGCIRMRNTDVVDLFSRVSPGTPLLVSEGKSAAAATAAAPPAATTPATQVADAPRAAAVPPPSPAAAGNKILLNLPQGARELTQAEELFFKDLPNETRRLFIWAIDRTMDGHVDASAIENRLAQELADVSNRLLKQSLWVIDSQTQGYAQLQAVQSGPSLDGGVVNSPPDSITSLLSKTQLPVKNLMVERDSKDYEVRLNNYIVAGFANTSFLNIDRQELQAWRNVLADMTVGADSPNPAPSTVGSTHAAGNTSFKSSKLISGDQKTAREYIVQAANEQKYPVNRLLAQMFQESTYKPDALGPYLKKYQTKAAGIAQFIPDTGKTYGLQTYTSDFFDPYKSALAAIQYMRWLERQVSKIGVSNDPDKWYFALAAYNWGIGNVTKKACDKNLAGKTNLKWNDLAAHAPTETQQYVQKIIKLEANPA